MQRRWYLTTLALVAACSESAPSPTGPALALPDQAEHIFWARGRGPSTPLGLMTWHGGGVMVASKTYAIYWGSDWNTPTFAGDKITGLTTFFQGWGGSGYAGLLTEYGGQNGQITAASTYLGSVIDPSAAPAGPPDALSVIAEVEKLVPVPDPAALYVVYGTTPRGTSTACAWHTAWSYKRHPVQVAWVFNLDGDPGCDPHDSFTAHSQGLAALANVTAHELAETITDPRFLGWFASGGAGEVGDKCAFVFAVASVTFANASIWHLQGEWSNTAYNAGTGSPNGVGEAGCVYAAAGGGGGATPSVAVGDNFYNPTPDTLATGTTVTFPWIGSAPHDVVWDTGPGTLPVNSALMFSGVYGATLDQAGTYTYHCSIHGSAGAGMHGAIVVR